MKTEKKLNTCIFTFAACASIIILMVLETYRTEKNTNNLQGHEYKTMSYTAVNSQVPDLTIVNNIIDKKKIFFKFMRPIIESENAKVIIKRKTIFSIFNKKSPNRTDISKAQSIASEYGFESFDIKNLNERNELISRVDIIPVKLALVQSANETAWGTSRFAKLGNNMFGQWSFAIGKGLVPERRDKGATHEVAIFKSINDSVASYLHNLNTGSSYQRLRQLRHEMRLQNKQIDPVALAEGLIKYSSMGKKYVKIIISMIKSNQKYM